MYGACIAHGHGLLSSRLYFIYFVFLTVWLLEFTNNSFNTTEIAETFPKNRINKLISERKYSLGFDRREGRNTLLQRQITTLIHRLVSNSLDLYFSLAENPGMVSETRANSTHGTLTSR